MSTSGDLFSDLNRLSLLLLSEGTMNSGRAEWHLHQQCHPEAGRNGLGTSTNNRVTLPLPSLATYPYHPLFPFHSNIRSSYNNNILPSGAHPGMNDDPGVQFLATRSRKRPHREMSQSHHRSESPLFQRGEASSSSSSSNRRPTSRLNLPTMPPTRFHGDGLDYRQPVMSASPQTDNVIDLTDEPDSPPQRSHAQQTGANAAPRPLRPPRFGRDVVADVVDLEEEPEPHSDSPSSPEVQFVRATTRPQPPRHRGFTGSSRLLDMLRFQGQRLLPGSGYSENAIAQEIARRTRDLARRPPPNVETFRIGNGSDLTIVHSDVPMGMDYETPGFTLDNAPRPTYKPPSPPPEGFTRTAQEDDVVVCPNCGDELGTGDELKQQIWVAKPCGHVYCGECSKNRSLSKAKKAVQSSQSRVKPFSKCQVADCGKPVSQPKSMFQVYL